MTRYVLTGAPGTGKTATLALLGSGVHRVGEPARGVLAEHRSTGRAIPAPDRFAELLLERSIAKHVAAGALNGTVVFDRGIPDCIAYAEWLGADPDAGYLAADRHRYHPEALLMRPWAEIYTTDDERTMTFDAIVEFQQVIEAAYLRTGYSFVEVPQAPIDERAAFILDFVASR